MDTPETLTLDTVEMEGYGIVRACELYNKKKNAKVKWLICKAKMDRADSSKSDTQPRGEEDGVSVDVKQIAATASAKFVKQLLKQNTL